MKQRNQFETCITVEYCNLTLREGYQIGQELEAFLKHEGLGYYYGSSRQPAGARMCFKFFLHVPTELYPRALAAIFSKLKEPGFYPGGKVVTNHSWLIRKEKNTELYSRIQGLVRRMGFSQAIAIQHPEMVAITLSALPEGQYEIREGDAQRIPSEAKENQVLVCIR